MSCPFDLVMFDLDGTLIETAPEIADAVNDTLRQFGMPEVMQQQVNDWIGHGTRELLIQALALRTGTDAKAMRASSTFPGIADAFAQHYLKRCGTRSRLYPDVLETLQALRAKGVKTAVVTNKESHYTDVVLNAHALQDQFDCVISGDTLPTKKPNPAAIAHCLALFDVRPERALFVGDSSIDVTTARNGGVPIWALPYGYNMGQPISASHPDRVIATCAELVAA